MVELPVPSPTALARSLKSSLKTRVSPEWRQRVRRLNRFRWITKYRALREFGVDPVREPRTAARFVLLDPELDNFTYELENEHELAAWLGAGLGIEEDRASAFIDELRADRHLHAELERLTRRRLDVKTRPEFGSRLAYYAIIRATRPELVVEAGVQDGLGTVTMLQALERNAEEGAPGRLKSFDVLPGSGWLVPERLRRHWELVVGSTWDTFEPALAGERIGLLVHDGENTHESECFEFRLAIAQAADRLVMLTSRADTGGLRDVAREAGLDYHEFEERPRHFYPGSPQGLAVYEPAASGG